MTTPLTPQQFEQIQKQLSRHASPDKQLQFVADLSADAAYAEQVFLQSQLQQALANQAFAAFRATLMRVETEYHNNDLRAALPNDEQPTYSLDELLSLFAAVPHYEAALAYTERGATHQHLLMPQNGANFAAADDLVLQWDSPITEALVWILENNQEDELMRLSVPALVQQYRIALPTLSVGRYYFKLIGEHSGMYVGMFFVDKHLMDEHLI